MRVQVPKKYYYSRAQQNKTNHALHNEHTTTTTTARTCTRINPQTPINPSTTESSIQSEAHTHTHVLSPLWRLPTDRLIRLSFH